jgi:putative ABC transport system ATP-binding protein
VTAIIEARGLTKIHNRNRPDEVTALRDADCAVAAGECVILRGPSGSGKTTLLSLVGCMARPTAGAVLVEGRDVGRLPERFLTEVRRSTFGFVFQNNNLLGGLTVEENVVLPLVPLAMGFDAMRRRAEAVLETMDLLPKRCVKAGRLSGGEQQRVALARALVAGPRIVIADEPTAHLDRALAERLMATFGTLHREGVTLLIATHDPFVADQPFAGQVIEMRDGRIVGEAAR